jgi:hypothetical protein
MSTTPAPAAGTSVTFILTILQIALQALSTVPAIGADVALASVFINIIQQAMNAYHAAAGVPLDLSKLPMETPVP